MPSRMRTTRIPILGMVLVCLTAPGCQTDKDCRAFPGLPHELAQVTHPPYTISPPDMLLVDVLNVVPLPPYRVQPLDVLMVTLNRETLPRDFPAELMVGGLFQVSPEGTINLGVTYGSVRVVGMTLKQARAAVERRVRQVIQGGGGRPSRVEVLVELAQSRAMQQVRGEHLVRPDGTVNLGVYGSVYVAGMTLDDAKREIETHLSKYLLNPEISLDVSGYNSKVFYIVFDGATSGEQIVRLPITGNDTVLDALSQVSGLPPVASKRKIWIARPTPAENNCAQVLPVNYSAIVRGGSTATNYQIFPGDRIYVDSQSLVRLDNTLAKIISPMERLFGITLLGNSTVISLRDKSGGGGTGTGTGTGTGF